MAPPPFPAADVRWQWRGVGHIEARRADGAPSLDVTRGHAALTRTPPHQYPECGVGDAAGVDAAPAPADG